MLPTSSVERQVPPSASDEPPNPWGSPPPTPLRPNIRPNRPPNRPNRPGNPWGTGSGGTGGPPSFDELWDRFNRWFRPRGPRGPGGPGRGFGSGWPGGRGAVLVAAALLVAWLASGFYRVEPDEQGVVLRFGAFTRTTLPGLNYHLPYPVESVLTPAVTRVNRVEVGYRSADGTGNSGFTRVRAADPGTSGREVLEEALMLTGDENIIDINFAVFWRIRDPVAFLFSIRNPERTVKSVVESVMREVIGRTPIQPALTQARAQIELSVLTGSQAVLDGYGAGIDLLQVQLQKVDPPAEVIESFRDQQRANADADRARNEAESYRNDIVPRARGDAARVTAAADGARQASIAEATGQAQRFLSVLNAYALAKDVTLQRLYIETMESVLRQAPTTVVDDGLRGVVPYLPIDPAPARPAAPAQGAQR